MTRDEKVAVARRMREDGCTYREIAERFGVSIAAAHRWLVPRPTGKASGTHGWCPECKEESAVDRDRRCLWCGERTYRRKPGHPGGVKFSERDLRALHRLHMQGASLSELGDAVYRKRGYGSGRSAAEAISRGFKRLGLPARGPTEGTAVANRRRRIYKEAPPTADQAAYRRWLRRRRGKARRCQGVKLQPPGKGSRCQRFASPGSDFCRYHDPAKREAVVEAAARLRESQVVDG